MTEGPVLFDIPRDLITWEPSDAPVVSCYVDWSTSGRGLHEASTVVRHDLREALRGVLERGEAHASLEADVARIERFLAEEADAAAKAFAIFACDARGLWEVFTLGVELPTRVHAGERPLLLPLIESTQDAARTLVVLADTNTARFFRLSPSGAVEAEGPHRSTATVKHSTKGGWGAIGYQRHVDLEVYRFAEEVARDAERLMAERNLGHLVLAGDEVIVPPLTAALSQGTRERLDAAEHIDIRAALSEVEHRIWPEVAEIVRARRARETEAILGRVEAGRNAVGEPASTLEALEAGRVYELAIDPDVLEEEVAELAVRQALAHRSRVLVERGHEALAARGGLAATLR